MTLKERVEVSPIVEVGERMTTKSLPRDQGLDLRKEGMTEIGKDTEVIDLVQRDTEMIEEEVIEIEEVEEIVMIGTEIKEEIETEIEDMKEETIETERRIDIEIGTVTEKEEMKEEMIEGLTGIEEEVIIKQVVLEMMKTRDSLGKHQKREEQCLLNGMRRETDSNSNQ